MPELDLRFASGAVHLPALRLWLDPHEPKTGPERVFISHAHSDHIAEHREVILTEPTARLMEARLPGARLAHVLSFGRQTCFENDHSPFHVTLWPAGHIFGSAMALVEAGGQKVLYTGDFKLRRGLSAEPCQPHSADILIMETTFGRPQYVFPPSAQVLANVVRFCRETLDNDETPVLLGYSLGKSQELLCSLGDAGLPLMLHGAVFNLTRVYEQFGQCFPPYERYQANTARGKVLLCPPNVVNSAMLRNLGPFRSAILTGWAVDPNCKYRYQCDAAFPLSDHADFPELIDLVKQVSPRLVYTLHGFAADFAHTLRDLGYDARALSEDEQLALRLGLPGQPVAVKTKAGAKHHSPASHTIGNGRLSAKPNRFFHFAETCGAIARTPAKLGKVRLLAEYLRGLEGDALRSAAIWFSGAPFAPGQNRALQLGWAVIRNAISAATGKPPEVLHHAYMKHSDIGEAVAEVLDVAGEQSALSLEEVSEVFDKLYAARGPVGKTPILSHALAGCTPLEAKYLVKIITGDLRIGLKEGLVEEGIALAFSRTAAEVRQANLLLGDIGQTALLARDDRLGAAALTPLRPVKSMLASPEPTAADVWERMHARARESEAQAPDRLQATERLSLPGGAAVSARNQALWVEDKYDGIRCQLHKLGRQVALFSRDLKEITRTFPELADAVRDFANDFVMDGEIVAVQDEEVLPFAELQKRLGRREPDLFMRDEVPVHLMAFDLLWRDGLSLLDQPLRERRAQLEALQPLPRGLRLARISQADSAAEIEAAFAAVRARGNEGLMIKDPESRYAPGRRGLAWLKLKKAFATLDCVVIGAEHGHGKRNRVLSDYTFAVRDENTGELKTIGKAYSGLTDAEIAGLTEHFLRTATGRHGRYFEVPPDTVLEIAFDRLQRSDRHSSGLAMRFPRIARIRTDKSVNEIDTLQTARQLLEESERRPQGADREER